MNLDGEESEAGCGGSGVSLQDRAGISNTLTSAARGVLSGDDLLSYGAGRGDL